MAYEKAGEMEREIEEIIEGAECILTDRADLYSLLAVSAASMFVASVDTSFNLCTFKPASSLIPAIFNLLASVFDNSPEANAV